MKQTLNSGTLYLAISNIFFMISGYLIYFVLGRILDPASYGIYALIITIISLLNLLFISGLPTAVSKFISEDESKAIPIRNKALKIQILFSIVITTLYFFSANAIANLLNDKELIQLLKISSIVIPLYAIYSVIVNYYNGLHMFRKQSFLTITYSISKLLLVIGLVYFFHIGGAILGFALSPLVALIFAIDLKKSKENYNPNKLIGFAMPVIILTVSLTLISTLDLLFVKSLLKDNVLTGYYSAAERISKAPYFLLTAIGTVLLPSISRSISRESIEETKSIINRSLKILLLLLIPGTLLISFSSTKIVSLLYSSKYISAGFPLSILVFGAGFLTVFSILSSIINASNKPKVAMLITLLSLPIAFILNYILIGKYGLVGAAIATTVTTFIMMIVATIYTYKLHKTLVSIKSVLKISIAGLIISTPVLFINNKFLLLAAYPILLLVYLAIMIVIKEINKNELKQLFPKQISSLFGLE